MIKILISLIGIIGFLHADMDFSKAKKEKIIYPKGKILYEKKCKHFFVEFDDFDTLKELKVYIKNKKLCNKINSRYLNYLAMYLWDVKRVKKADKKITLKYSDKCPVCGMFVYKYPKWAAKIILKNKKYFVFDGVKDMMKFYFQPQEFLKANKKEFKELLVSDYYTLKPLDATKAYYVIKSNIYGPMGHELIPFSDLKSAKDFIKDHKGEVIRFDKITIDLVYKLDE